LPEVSWLFFKARAKHPYLSHTGRSAAAEENSQLAPAQRVAMKMGRRPRCSSVTSRTSLRAAEANQTITSLKLVRDAPSSRLADGPF
jgi:hypothetical protein